MTRFALLSCAALLLAACPDFPDDLCSQDSECPSGFCDPVSGTCAPVVEDRGDGGPADAGPTDAGPADAGPADAGTTDAGPTDAGPADAGPADAGTIDAGPTDAGPADAGTTDAGPTDAGPADAGTIDAGWDGGGEADGGPEDGGEIGDGGEPLDCRALGSCLPNKYADADQGLADTTDYYKLGVFLNGDFVASNGEGRLPQIDGFADDQAMSYWLVSPVNDQAQPLDLFPQGATVVNRIFVFPPGSGRPVIDVGADSADYSPLLQVWRVDVPAGYVPDALKSAQSILASAADSETGILVTATNEVVLLPVVDPDITLEGAGGPSLEELWQGGFRIHGYRFAGGNPDGTVPISAASAAPWVTPPDPFLSALHQFRQAQGACFGRNVYSALYGATGYAPVPVLSFWVVEDGCPQVPTSEGDVMTAVGQNRITPHPTAAPLVVVAPQVPR